MIKVLHKAIDIVELLAKRPGESVALGEIAGELGMGLGTCSNILKTLIARGLAEQIAPKKGYRLGPLAYSLASRGPYRQDIVSVAEPIIAAASTRIDEAMLLATVRGGRRYILCKAESSRMLQVRTDAPYFTDLYETATGRLLLAYMPDHERESYVLLHGLPGSAWPAAAGARKLAAELERIREAGVTINDDQPDLAQVACAVFEGGRAIAAVGASLPAVRFAGPQKKDVLARTEAAARDISSQLPAERTAGRQSWSRK